VRIGKEAVAAHKFALRVNMASISKEKTTIK
jgi:hypothetical protein